MRVDRRGERPQRGGPFGGRQPGPLALRGERAGDRSSTPAMSGCSTSRSTSSVAGLMTVEVLIGTLSVVYSRRSARVGHRREQPQIVEALLGMPLHGEHEAVAFEFDRLDDTVAVRGR